MTKMYQLITDLLAKKPVKTIFAAVLILVVMVVGVSQIEMATGNETLVQTDTEAYLSNLAMEESFGGDSIIVLFTAENDKAGTDLANIQGMWKVHQALDNNDSIFSMMSPAAIVSQIASKQFEEITGRVEDISAGLYEMSGKMIELSDELGSKEIKDPREIEAKLGELAKVTDVFSRLIGVQNNLSAGTSQLQSGLGEMASGLGQVSGQLQTLVANTAGNPELSQQLGIVAGNIEASSQGLAEMANKTGQLKIGNTETAKGLTEIQKQLSSELGSMQGSLSGGFSPDQVTEMAVGFAEIGANLNNIGDALAMFYRKSGMLVPAIPNDQEELDQIFFAEDGEMRAAFANVTPTENNFLMIVKLEGNLSDAEKDAVYSDLTRVLERQEFGSFSYVVTGRPVLDTSLRADMQANMKSMVAFAVGTMLVILLLIFKVRWRILPLVTVFIAVVATLGLMGSVGIPMTMVSMAVFPILIGLGIDYSIQFQSRYEEEHSLKATLMQMGPAIGTAVFATVLGFIALFISPVPMIQDFGKMLSIGIIVSYLAGFFLLMPILYIRDKFFGVTGASPSDRKPNWLEHRLRKLTGGLLKYAVVIVVIAVALAAWGTWADGKVAVQTDIETFMPQDTPALADLHLLRDVMKTTDQVVLYLEDDDVLSEENWTWIAEKTESLEKQFSDIVVDTKSIATLVWTMSDGSTLGYGEAMELIAEIPAAQSKIFLSPEKDKSIITLGIKHLPIDDVKEFIDELGEYVQDTGMQLSIIGKSSLDVEMVKGLTSGRTQMTFLGLGLVFLGLLLIYRNFFKAFIPVFPISLIVGLSGGIMQILGLKYTPLTATLGALILGIGTEMTILLLERYIEERHKGLDKIQAMETAVGKIGVAIIASGLTTIGGFAVLMTSKFIILKDFGMMTVINMSLALLSTLIVLPAVIFLLDRWIIRPVKKEFAS